MKFIRILSVLLPPFLLGLGACTFDDDGEFFPITSQAFFLLGADEGTNRRFVRIEGDQVTENVGTQWGVSQEQVGDFYLDEEILWIGDVTQKRLIKIDLEDSEDQESIDLGQLTPHFLQAGDRHVLLSDTLSNQIGFLHKRRMDLVVRTLEEQPGIAAYRSGKFYLQIGDSSVSIFQEQSFSETDKFDLGGPIKSIQIDPSTTFTYVYFLNEELMGVRIDFNTNGLSGFSIPNGVEKILHSTIDTPRFDKESTGLATLFSDGIFRLEALSLGQVEDVSVDFFENQVYIRQLGQWIRRDVRTGEQLELGSLTGNFYRSAFYRDFIGN
ncbi:MAG: hypothetical protein AAF694_30385 [Bacteroidota bacterium]